MITVKVLLLLHSRLQYCIFFTVSLLISALVLYSILTFNVFDVLKIKDTKCLQYAFLIILARKSVIKIKHNLFLPIFIYGIHYKVQFMV